ncbi:BnaA09g47710D [Brassica napus]|uniref:BnaA09g47710D protein n=1 Tax=Brassica napus TaxID=3708 RepID=A0A078H8M0_BRANA|nr:BnaA09g47710D [Brassica napus]
MILNKACNFLYPSTETLVSTIQLEIDVEVIS